MLVGLPLTGVRLADVSVLDRSVEIADFGMAVEELDDVGGDEASGRRAEPTDDGPHEVEILRFVDGEPEIRPAYPRRAGHGCDARSAPGVDRCRA